MAWTRDEMAAGAAREPEDGLIANWTIPGKVMKGMGGAMDPAADLRRGVVDRASKAGEPNIHPARAMPLTGKGCVDLIVTDPAVMRVDCDRCGRTPIRPAPGVTLEQVGDRTATTYVGAEGPSA